MNSMVMSMIGMESGWEKDHRMSHTEGVGMPVCALLIYIAIRS